MNWLRKSRREQQRATEQLDQVRAAGRAREPLIARLRQHADRDDFADQFAAAMRGQG